MKIYSKRFKTELEFEDNMIIKFQRGIPGFAQSKRFCILDMDDTEAPFKWLHDVDNTEICLLITDPYYFFPNYEPQIDEKLLHDLDVKTVQKEVTVFTIVKIINGGKEAFTNLRAPVVVNANNKKACQVILEDDTYAIKTPLFSELKKQGNNQKQNPKEPERTAVNS
ncbi:hypothetical protein BVY03_06155 [bacterium K02(2017)]|nr:hypothetical protein BVY03_06155 [bacterium K02(2017)]